MATTTKDQDRRGWLATLLLRQHDRFGSRLVAALARWRATPRELRRRAQRRASLTAAGAALALALSAPVTSNAHAAAISVVGGCSLADAILSANTDTSVGGCAAGNGADTITLTGDVTLTTAAIDYRQSDTGLPLVTSEITIDGAGFTIARDGGAPVFRVLATDSSGDLTLENVTISGGHSEYSGGGIFNNGTLTLTGSTVSGNVADGGGGGIHTFYGELTLVNSTVSDNTARSFAGGIFATISDVYLTDSTVSGNHGRLGGGIYSDFAPLTLTNTIVSGNTADYYGGGIWNDEDLLTFTGGAIRDNTSGRYGGGLFNRGRATLTNVIISGNVAGWDGGGLVQRGGPLTLIGSTISGNEAVRAGGGAMISVGTLYVTAGSVISDNAAERGGGVYTRDGLRLTGSAIRDNEAHEAGGGLYIASPVSYGGTAGVSGSTISGNSAPQGGGVFNDNSALTLTNSTVSSNAADASGGGLFSDGAATATLTNTTFSGNTAGDGGGGLYGGPYSTTSLARGIVAGNSAVDGGDEVFVASGATVTAGNHNVFGHGGSANAGAFTGFTPGVSDVTATSDGTDPTALAGVLDTALADNGGPTLTHNLVPGSPALDLAPDADCAAAPVNSVDQRGVARPVDVPGEGNNAADTCDAGAVEYGSPPPPPAGVVLVSTTAAGSVDGVDFGPHDILMWDGTDWSKWFDGTAAGLSGAGKARHNANAIFVPDAPEPHVLMSFLQDARLVPGITGKVDGVDVVHWDGSAFELAFDGQDVGLTQKSNEKIDALHVLDGDVAPAALVAAAGGSCIDYFLISTAGPGQVTGYDGRKLKFGGEDVLGFCMTQAGATTQGKWMLVLDGSMERLPRNSVFGLSAGDDGQVLYLMTNKRVTVDGLTFERSMVFSYDLATGTFAGPLLDVAGARLTKFVDGVQY